MAYPTREQIMESEIEYLTGRGDVHVRELYSFIREKFKMTPGETAVMHDKEPYINYDIRWSLQTLKSQGRVENGSRKGYWRRA